MAALVCRIPFQNTYPPLLHNIVAAIAALTGISAGSAYHAVTAFFYCLGPVTIYLLLLRISRSQLAGISGSLFYSVFSTSALLLPSVRHDLATVWGARRLQVLLAYGEGPHIASMALLPIPVLLLDLALERKRIGWWLATAVSMACVALTNWLGAFALAAAILAYGFSRPLGWRDRGGIALTGLYAYTLAMPWIPPSTISAIRTNAQKVGGEFAIGPTHILYFVIAAIAFWGLSRLGRRLTPWVSFIVLFTACMAALPMLGEFAHVYLLPQPERYHTEMEMGLAMLTGALFAYLAVRSRTRYGTRLFTAVVVVGLIFCVYSGKKLRRRARELVTAIDMRGTVEFQAPTWANEHLPGIRVLVPGSVAFWWNAFASNPQLMGGFDQGITNARLPEVHYQLLTGEGEGGRDLAIALLKAYGVGAVMVGGQHSREVYHPFHRLERFEGLQQLWRSGDDVIYGIPGASASLAHAVPPQKVVPVNLDYSAMTHKVIDFAGALGPSLQWKSTNWHTVQTSGTFQPDDVLSVQMAYDPGWHATANGVARAIRPDGLGLMVVEPHCSGPCAVSLIFDGGAEAAVAKWLSLAALLGGLLLCALPPKLKLWPSTTS